MEVKEVMSFNEALKELTTVDLFKEAANLDAFIGRPFYFDFNSMKVLSNDHWKEKVGGIPAGAFHTAVYDNDPIHPEVVLLRVLGPHPSTVRLGRRSCHGRPL